MGLFGRKAQPEAGAEKLFFATDLHASESCFRKLLATPRVYGVGTVLMGGDCTGKMLIPVVTPEAPGGAYRCDWGGESVETADEGEIAEVEKRIRYAGLYPMRVTAAEHEVLRRDSARLGEAFSARMLETVRAWTALAEERLAPTGTHTIMTPGNDDEFDVDEILAASDYVDAPEGRITRIGRHELLSVGWSNTTPWQTPRECPEDELAAKIDALAAQIEDMENAIFNIHVPPYGTGLDNAPKLDDDLRPVQGGTVMVPVGSTAVRDAILRHAPLLSLHGHIHESRGVQKLGRTTCINPGSVYGEGILQGVIVELFPGKVRYSLTDG
jgi:Icc-related predicted phosphoesterase